MGEERPTAALPTRSALLGLLGAALGIDRADADALTRLSSALSVGVLVERRGQLLRDYHTTQVGEGKESRDRRTRHDELTWMGPQKVTTILSSRDYLCDAAFTVGFWHERDESTWDMEELASALARPVWHLYFGRKSCVPGAPMRPMVRRARTFRQALEQREEELGADPILDALGRTNGPRRVAWQGAHGGWEAHEEVSRRDEPGSRVMWQFFTRQEQRGWHTVEE